MKAQFNLLQAVISTQLSLIMYLSLYNVSKHLYSYLIPSFLFYLRTRHQMLDKVEVPCKYLPMYSKQKFDPINRHMILCGRLSPHQNPLQPPFVSLCNRTVPTHNSCGKLQKHERQIKQNNYNNHLGGRRRRDNNLSKLRIYRVRREKG